MRARWERERAQRLVEDVIRTYPEGATSDVLVGRLVRVGVEEPDARALLAEMADARRLRLAGERWLLQVT